MAEQVVRLHQNGGLRYEAHLNGDESVVTYTDDGGNIDIYIRGSHDSGVVLTGPLGAELNAAPASEPEPKPKKKPASKAKAKSA